MSDERGNVSESLINAVKNGNLESVKNLVHIYGLSYCEGWQGGYILLCDAIKFDHPAIAMFLIVNGAKIDCDTDRVNTPLHLAIKWEQWWIVVSELLRQGAPIDARNRRNQTALHLAAEMGHSKIVQLLLEKNASITVQTRKGFTPLFLAVMERRDLIVKMLFQHARTNLQDEIDGMPSVSPEKRKSALLNRILLCNPRACKQVNKLVENIITHNYGDFSIVEELVNHGFILSQEHVNRSSLLSAVKNNRIKVMDYILRYGGKPDNAQPNPLPLLAAVGNGDSNIANVILNAGSDADVEDTDAKLYLLLLETAAENERSEIFKLLLNAGSNARDEKDCLCVEEDKCVEVIQLLLANGADIKDAPILLPTVADLGLVKVCKLLIESGADVNAQNKLGQTALFKICAYDSKEAVVKRKDIITLLLSSGADVSIKAPSGHTAFHKAVSNGCREAVDAFLDCGVDVDLRAVDNSTPLHVASEKGQVEIVEILLKNKANVDACNDYGSTPLHCASHSRIVELLCKNKADVNARKKSGVTPLLCLCSTAKDPSCGILSLLKFGADIDARGLKNETALHRLFLGEVAGWWNETVTSLLNSGYDINAETKEGRTALELAISRITSKIQHRYSFDPCAPLKTLSKHVIKLKAAGLYVSEKNFNFINDINGINDSLGQFVSHELPDFQQECEEEIKQLKNEQVEPSCTLYNVLVDGKEPYYARNKSLMLLLRSFSFQDFPIYGGLISGIVQRNESRLEFLSFLNLGQRMLSILLKTSNKLNGNKYPVLPAEMLGQIVSYLRNIDLKNLIACGEALKRQLKRQVEQQ